MAKWGRPVTEGWIVQLHGGGRSVGDADDVDGGGLLIDRQERRRDEARHQHADQVHQHL